MIYLNENGEFSLKYSKSVKLNENSEFKVYDKIIMSIAGDFAENSINQDFGSGHRVLNITPSDDVINQVFSNAESEGFKEVDAYIDEDNTWSDSYVVFTKETDDRRIVFAVVFNAAENFAYVTCGYNEEEDSEYFD